MIIGFSISAEGKILGKVFYLLLDEKIKTIIDKKVEKTDIKQSKNYRQTQNEEKDA